MGNNQAVPQQSGRVIPSDRVAPESNKNLLRAFEEVEAVLRAEGMKGLERNLEQKWISLNLSDGTSKTWTARVRVTDNAVVVTSYHPNRCEREHFPAMFKWLNESNDKVVIGCWELDTRDGEVSFRCGTFYESISNVGKLFKNIWARNISTFSQTYEQAKSVAVKGSGKPMDGEIGAVLLEALLAALKKSKESSKEDSKEQKVNVEKPTEEKPKVPEALKTEEDRFLIKKEELEKVRKLGEGAFGKVELHKWRGTPVAVKKVKIRLTNDVKQAFMEEIGILKRLVHPNIILFMGVVEEPACIVTEFCEQGTLEDVIEKSATKKQPLVDKKRVLYLRGACAGMIYLHDRKIYHGDIKAANILIDNDRAKIADFGLAKAKSMTVGLSSSIAVGGFTPNHVAPEILETGKGRMASDVYSFSIVMNYTWSEQTPFLEHIKPGIELSKLIVQGIRPSLGPNIPPPILQAIKLGWQKDPEKRPKFEDLIQVLDAVSEKL